MIEVIMSLNSKIKCWHGKDKLVQNELKRRSLQTLFVYKWSSVTVTKKLKIQDGSE